ncbi:MerR family transcriptional regulator [Methylovirgula ligni]|uniref:DNA-binding transcriptional MerR regulator n=1 Tax=Methylovirgula ligni TaxID=569860 RepID=A0A3D9YZK7_9HYPH|nr:MerR family transcriptional regulator [Methylovirgula ligni]QAY97412.1 MerR family transcriptional regulator [Methylovirgula ligni]REF88152.1 DNA-binding transcriptional MerR regulator [Methylovirgula ligni]
MLISEFVRETGLSKDTVRFYVRLGLLAPEADGKGGRHPYQVFTQEHVRAARVIRLAQSLGFSLKEIAAFSEEHQNGGLGEARTIEILSAQLSRLEEKAAELNAMSNYLRAKLTWLKSGSAGKEPDIADYAEHIAGVACVDTAEKATGTSRPRLRSAAR